MSAILAVGLLGGAFALPPTPTDTSQLTAFTNLLKPHALELSNNLSIAAEASQGRKLQQVWKLLLFCTDRPQDVASIHRLYLSQSFTESKALTCFTLVMVLTLELHSTSMSDAQATLPDGSLCCPTKPVLTALPPIPPNDATLTYPQYVSARCQFNIVGNGQVVNGIVSASIVCETADHTDVLMCDPLVTLLFWHTHSHH